jgi:hypothetical protein
MDDRTYSQLLEDRAVARRAAQANAQALSEKVAELAYARPMADAGHEFCAARIYAEDHPGHGWDIEAAEEELFAAHRATTPAAVPSSHVIVERVELERLQAIATAAEDWATNAARAVEFLRGTERALYVAVRRGVS